MESRWKACALILVLTLGAGCAETQSPDEHAVGQAGIVGSWLEEAPNPDLLLVFYPNNTADLKYLLTVQNVDSTITRNGTWTTIGADQFNLSYTGPFTGEDRVISLQVKGDRAVVTRVYNRTAELPESRMGMVNASFIRVAAVRT